MCLLLPCRRCCILLHFHYSLVIGKKKQMLHLQPAYWLTLVHIKLSTCKHFHFVVWCLPRQLRKDKLAVIMAKYNCNDLNKTLLSNKHFLFIVGFFCVLCNVHHGIEVLLKLFFLIYSSCIYCFSIFLRFLTVCCVKFNLLHFGLFVMHQFTTKVITNSSPIKSSQIHSNYAPVKLN